ncbi:hypothetical protein FRC14_001416 [Serendipita sp. 396]|nr:hypothetical protein FRC14_001416 [Serendipita sp. 396]KAG8788891.1 hypothetical protein FRC15_001406 [Serendipita sp. 397]KAG8828790.1 hypothetical protein FRC19_000178 [Serendipita sp. 401]KAG9058687.1 hypothetical protein FS842_006024 [Serendipita sp. 407]
MSETTHSRYLQNNLQPAALDATSLLRIRDQLRLAVFRGIEVIESQGKRVNDVDDSIYVGATGIALMYLRLIRQKESLNLSEEQEKFLLGRAMAYLSPRYSSPKTVRPGRLSPLDSTLGPAIMRIILELTHPTGSGEVEIQEVDIDTLEQAITVAKQDDTGTNEVLYGQSGLLHALCQLRGALGNGRLSGKRLQGLTNDQTLQFFADKIVDSGKSHASQGIPLYFEWHRTCYIGAIHGIAGIVTVLLQCPPNIIAKHRDVIIQSIKYICLLVQQNEGHLPPSLPVRQRSNPLVQICHGTPGYFLLLATLKKIFSDWLQEIEQDIEISLQSASDVIWKQGLLYKGLGICHGVTGNAWPWLLMASTNRGDNDEHLARALAFVQHATDLPPMPVPEGTKSPYRTPDRPYSLFEGLAGAVCCWSETCAVISSRLGDTNSTLLGIPGIGGIGISGML